MASIAQNLFRVSALINAISIPGHIQMGFELVHPAISTISSSPKHAIGQRGAQTAWNCINTSLLVAGILLHVRSSNHFAHDLSVIELAMEPYLWTTDSGREDHALGAVNYRNCHELSVLGGWVLSAFGVSACCAESQPAGLVDVPVSGPS